MQDKQDVETLLAESTLYQDSRKQELMESLDRQKQLDRRETDLMKEWDEVTARIEDIENSL